MALSFTTLRTAKPKAKPYKLAAQVSAANTFSAVAKAYTEKNARDGLVAATVRKREWFLSLLERAIGTRPFAEMAPFEVLEAVLPDEAAKNDEKSHRTLQFVGQVYRFAIANRMAATDATGDLRGALASRQPKPYAAVLEPKRVGGLLRAIDGYEGQPITRIALQLSPYVSVRPGELRRAEWAEIDLEAAVWRIPAGKMKGRLEHAVPLSRLAIALLRKAAALTGDGRYVFPSLRSPVQPQRAEHLPVANICPSVPR